MVGTLVVCLPCQHCGGQLVIRHMGKEVGYAWGGQEACEQSMLQWAFFYGDVEHEILPVASGHRITLCYNVYATHADGPPKAVDHRLTPFGRELQKALDDPDFLPDGGGHSHRPLKRVCASAVMPAGPEVSCSGWGWPGLAAPALDFITTNEMVLS